MNKTRCHANTVLYLNVPCPRASQGRRWQALCRPHPQNGRPPPKQVGRRSPVAERETGHKIRRFSPSWPKIAAILPSGAGQKNPESAYQRFEFAGVGETGKVGTLTC
ncbi:hypothetical protein [Xenorhabdus doucetiae]|uniref:hypothetical protein n=1 Tax=Xenorhabdus doucetiae TaxID=351671 RepID=UPI0005FA1B44|nr:hypothetical protein [Xenorhabdus doucetiae]